jgi:ATP-dependent Clp protease ATP-binding subunit ClpA
MFERFTTSARESVVRAGTESRELRHSFIGTEHLLLALLADPQAPVALMLHDAGVDHARVRADIVRLVGPSHDPATGPLSDPDAEDAAALKAIGIDLDAVRRAIEQNFGPGALRLTPGETPRRRGFLRRPSGSGRSPFTARAKKVLELGLREAVRLKHNYIAAEHLMLGILREGNGLAAQILVEAGVDFDRLRAELTRSLQRKAA